MGGRWVWGCFAATAMMINSPSLRVPPALVRQSVLSKMRKNRRNGCRNLVLGWPDTRHPWRAQNQPLADLGGPMKLLQKLKIDEGRALAACQTHLHRTNAKGGFPSLGKDHLGFQIPIKNFKTQELGNYYCSDQVIDWFSMHFFDGFRVDVGVIVRRVLIYVRRSLWSAKTHFVDTFTVFYQVLSKSTPWFVEDVGHNSAPLLRSPICVCVGKWFPFYATNTVRSKSIIIICPVLK